MNLLSLSGDRSAELISGCCHQLATAATQHEGTRIIAETLAKYTIFDLQYIGGYIRHNVDKLPNPYRNRYRPYSQDLLNQYSTCMKEYRCGIPADTRPIKDPSLWKTYWEITPGHCFDPGPQRPDEPFPQMKHPMNTFFYRLVYGYVMLIKGGYGHPVGMPFPGGFTVRQNGDRVLCPIRDKEKDLPAALCNYCPAEQDPDFL